MIWNEPSHCDLDHIAWRPKPESASQVLRLPAASTIRKRLFRGTAAIVALIVLRPDLSAGARGNRERDF